MIVIALILPDRECSSRSVSGGDRGHEGCGGSSRSPSADNPDVFPLNLGISSRDGIHDDNPEPRVTLDFNGRGLILFYMRMIDSLEVFRHLDKFDGIEERSLLEVLFKGSESRLGIGVFLKGKASCPEGPSLGFFIDARTHHAEHGEDVAAASGVVDVDDEGRLDLDFFNRFP